MSGSDTPYSDVLRPRLRIILLTNARTAEPITIPESGIDGFFCDYRSDGEALIHIEEASETGYPVKAQAGLRMGARRLFITNTAQAGKYLYFWFGKGVHFVQPNADITAIDLIRAVTPPSLRTTPYYRLSSSTALNTIVTPAANTAGVVVSPGVLYSAGGSVQERLMAKASAPSAWNDPAAITIAVLMANADYSRNFDGPFVVPAGFGLYEQADQLGAAGASFGYEVLT